MFKLTCYLELFFKKISNNIFKLFKKITFVNILNILSISFHIMRQHFEWAKPLVTLS